MDTSLRGASTEAAWRTWEAHNVAVGEEGVSIATEALPTYASGRTATIDPSADLVDVALAPCGDPYVLAADGTIYRYDPVRDRAEELSCVWGATGDPRALCVTADTIYVAGREPGAVQAISRYALGTRWIARDGVDAPVALARHDGAVYVLDAASYRGAASLLRVGRDSRLRPVVEGLMAPDDLGVGSDGHLWILDVLVGADPDGPGEPVVRRFDLADLVAGEPVPATDTVYVAPPAFRIHGTGESVPPTCLGVGSAGELLVGVDPDWDRQQALLRYRPADAAFERQPAHEAGGRAIAAPARAEDPRAYIVDADGRLVVLDGDYRTRRDAHGATAGRILTRFAASEEAIEWHRVHLERTLAGTENEVRVRYATTDAPDPAPEPDFEWDAPPLESLDQLDPTYAGRLRERGVEDLADLADLAPEAVRPMVSVEEVDVAESTVADWQAAAQSLLDGGEPPGTDVDAVDGIGPTYAARLAAGGLPGLETLVAAEPAEVARIASAGTLDVPLSLVEAWVEEAQAQRPEPPSYDDLGWASITPSSPRDALFEAATGRYCWMEVELLGTAWSSPTVTACRVEFPRETYLEELPAIYREDAGSAAFLERYLSLFERIFSDVESATEALPSYLDPDGIPDEPGHLAWLGEFLGMEVDGAWPTSAAREFVDRAPELYRMRGTRRGLRTATSIYLDHVKTPTPDWGPAEEREAAHLDRLVEAGLLTATEAEQARHEHAALAERKPAETVAIRAWTGLDCADEGPAREFYERLLGCPEGVLVLLHPRVDEADVQALSRIVAAQAPAHASVRTVGLDRRVQLAGTCSGEETAERGYHTYLGVNSALAERSFVVDDAGLGEETVLGSHEPDGQLDLKARLGADAHLS